MTRDGFLASSTPRSLWRKLSSPATRWSRAKLQVKRRRAAARSPSHSRLAHRQAESRIFAVAERALLKQNISRCLHCVAGGLRSVLERRVLRFGCSGLQSLFWLLLTSPSTSLFFARGPSCMYCTRHTSASARFYLLYQYSPAMLRFLSDMILSVLTWR